MIELGVYMLRNIHWNGMLLEIQTHKNQITICIVIIMHLMVYITEWICMLCVCRA